MRKFYLITIIALVLMFGAGGMALADLNEAAQSINADFNASNQMVQQGRQDSLAYANKASAELAEVSAKLDRATAEFDALKAEFDELLEIENALSAETGDYAEDLKALENIIKASAKELDQTLSESIITVEYPDMKANLAPLLEKERFPGMEDIENLVNAYFNEIRESGKVSAYEGAFINREGNEVASRIVRVGKFETMYDDNGKVGFLRLEPSIGQLLMTSGDPESRYLKVAKNYVAGNADVVPVDMTGGFIVTELGAENWFKYIVRAGGIVIWPLLIIAVVALLLCIERIVYLWRIPTHTDKVMQNLGKAISDGDFDACGKICTGNKRMPLCKVAKDVLDGFQRHQKVTKELLEDLLDESILKETPKLERFLTTLATLGAVSPLLGLLGTVTGMIHTFQSITVFGTGDPRLLAGGISEALVTTQVGLSIAIPVLLVHHFLSRRVEKIEDDLDEKGTALITTLRKQVYATQNREI